jgi:hypothetical protein
LAWLALQSKRDSSALVVSSTPTPSFTRTTRHRQRSNNALLGATGVSRCCHAETQGYFF